MEKQNKVLVLGVGRDLTQRLNVSDSAGPTFADNFHQVVTMDIDPHVKPTYVCSLDHPWPATLRQGDFDEVHAYEVLTLVGAGASGFFQVWANIWDALKPGGLAFGMTPWWESVWAWQDPSTKQVYSQEKLNYLSQSYYKEAMTTGYNQSLWRPPYSFITRASQQRGANPRTAGFTFVLQKEIYEGQD